MAEPLSKRDKTFKPKAAIKTDSHKSEMLHLVTRYDGSTKGLKQLTVKMQMNDVKWNQELLISLVGGETVFVHKDQANVSPGYVRVIHSDQMAVSVFMRSHFE